MSADDIKPGSPQYWGPRVWRIFHMLAEISDRRDIGMLWSNVLKATTTVMPCEQCRKHLTHYLRNNNVFRATNPITTTGKDIRQQIRLRLLHLHNDVNIRNKIAAFCEEDLTPTYGNKSRDVVLLEVNQLLNEVNRIVITKIT